MRQDLAQLGHRFLPLARIRQLQLNRAQFSATAEQFLRPSDIHRGKVRIEAASLRSEEGTDLQLVIDHVHPRANFVARFQLCRATNSSETAIEPGGPSQR